LCNDLVKFRGHAKARKRCIGNQTQTFTCAIINPFQNPESAAVGKLIRDKIEAPTLVWQYWHQHGARVPMALLRPPRLRTDNFSSRQGRNRRLW